MKNIILLLALLLLTFSCKNGSEYTDSETIEFNEIPTHCKEGAEPNLFLSETGDVYLSWIEYEGDSRVSLQYSKLDNESWSEPKKVARGKDWFVNWADFPSLVAYKDGGQSLAAHWLQKSAEGTYDYNVHISQSLDKGKTWSSSFIPHKDGISAEHGFVSLYPVSEDKIFATWLDGRNTKSEEHAEDSHGHHGAMSLRSAFFDKNGNVSEDAEMDNRVCDCCQTSAAITDKGMVVVYRDRSKEEIRDISIVRNVDGIWLEPRAVHNDNWVIKGCPVNGPVVVAKDNVVVVAWFSMADETPQVNVAFSNDSGRNFDNPIRVDDGDPIGRVDIEFLSHSEVIVSWLEQLEEVAEIRVARISQKVKEGKSHTITRSESSRQSGFPRMVRLDDQMVFAWTHVDSITSVKTALVPVDAFD